MSENLKIKLNGEPFTVEPGCTVEGLLSQIAKNKPASTTSNAVPKAFGAVAVEINAEIVPRNQFAQTQLKQGDAVEIVTLVGGG